MVSDNSDSDLYCDELILPLMTFAVEWAGNINDFTAFVLGCLFALFCVKLFVWLYLQMV